VSELEMEGIKNRKKEEGRRLQNGGMNKKWNK
jgi:hypothetical protein